MDDTNEPDGTIDGNVERFLAELRDDCLAAPLTARPQLAWVLAEGVPRTPALRRKRPMRTFAAKIAAAFATALAATGGLAAASALPAPVQSAFADVAAQVGVDLPSGGGADAPAITDPDPTTTTTEPTTSTTEPADADEPPETTTPTGDPDGAGEPEARNHGAEVSAVAHDDSVHGCEHGRAVSSVASGRPNDKPCPSHEATDDDTDEREDDADQPDEVDDDDSETVRAPNSGSPAAGQGGGERDNRGNGGEDDDGNGHGRGHGR